MDSPTRPKQRLSATERREQLLDATKSIVGDQGLHGVSVEAVAREAGITRPIVYNHFRDLDSLLDAMFEREGARALAQIGEIISAEPDPGDPRQVLLAALRGYLEVVEADPITWRLVLMPPEGAPEVLRERIAAGRAAVVAALAEVAGTGFFPGPGSPDPELTARMLSALADEGARLLLTDPRGYPIERLVAHARWMLEQLS